MIFQFILNVNEVVNMNLLCPIIAQSDPQDCKNQNGQLETLKVGRGWHHWGMFL